MEQQFIPDSDVREALQLAERGEFSRKLCWVNKHKPGSLLYYLKGESRKTGKIIYNLGNTLTVVGNCYTLFGIREEDYPKLIMTSDNGAKYEAKRRERLKDKNRTYNKQL